MPDADLAPGAIPSPNIWNHPQVYEIENRAVDRAGALTSLMWSLAPWDDRDLLDIGCGTGFHLPHVRREGPLRHRRRAARRPGGDGTPARAPPPERHGAARLGRGAAAARRLGRRDARALGLLLRAGLRAGAGRARPGDASGLAARSSSTTTRPARRSARGSGAATRRSTTSRRPRSGSTRAGSGTRSTSRGPSTRARTSSPSYASSSPPTWPRRSSPATRATSVDYAVSVWSRTW